MLIRNGLIYDSLGQESYRSDMAYSHDFNNQIIADEKDRSGGLANSPKRSRVAGAGFFALRQADTGIVVAEVCRTYPVQ